MLHYPSMQQRLSGTICPTDAVIDNIRFVFFYRRQSMVYPALRSLCVCRWGGVNPLIHSTLRAQYSTAAFALHAAIQVAIRPKRQPPIPRIYVSMLNIVYILFARKDTTFFLYNKHLCQKNVLNDRKTIADEMCVSAKQCMYPYTWRVYG